MSVLELRLKYYTEEELEKLAGQDFLVYTGLIFTTMYLSEDGKILKPYSVGIPTKAHSVRCCCIGLTKNRRETLKKLLKD